MIRADTKDIKRFEEDLKKLSKKAMPFATKDTLNSAAFNARGNAQGIIKRRMTLRNKWTSKTVQVNMSKTLNIRRQESAVGSTEKYMEVQEFGGTERAKGKHGVAIPTGYSAGQKGQRPRTRLPRRANKLVNIRIKRFVQSGLTRQQRNVRMVQEAVKTGKRYVFMHIGKGGGKRKGIFKVVGGNKNFKRGWPKGAHLEMVQDMTSKSVRIPRTPWLAPSVGRVGPRMPVIYSKALIKQIERQRLFRTKR